jgi:hypothetical protein
MVYNNLVVSLACITYVATSPTDLSVLVYIVEFLDPYLENPSSYIILFPSPNSNGCPSTNLGLLVGTYISSGLNTIKRGFVLILSFNNSLACGPPYCCYCCFCYYKFCGLPLLSIQFSYMSPSYVVTPQPLETRYHSPSWSFAFSLSSISHVEMTFAMHQHFASLLVLMLALHMVSLSLSSSSRPLPLCSPIVFWPPSWGSTFLGFVLPL